MIPKSQLQEWEAYSKRNLTGGLGASGLWAAEVIPQLINEVRRLQSFATSQNEIHLTTEAQLQQASNLILAENSELREAVRMLVRAYELENNPNISKGAMKEALAHPIVLQCRESGE